MKLTGQDLWEAYQKLPEKEKMKFDIKIKSVDDMKKLMTEKRSKVFDDLMSIQSDSGNSYFNKEWLMEKLLNKNA